jgi:hypothetical protein
MIFIHLQTVPGGCLTAIPYLLPAAGLTERVGVADHLPSGARPSVTGKASGCLLAAVVIRSRTEATLRSEFLTTLQIPVADRRLVTDCFDLSCFGTNPSGAPSPRLWLGGLGVYLQPSEPLKLLLVSLPDRLLGRRSVRVYPPFIAALAAQMLPLLAPTLVMTGDGSATPSWSCNADLGTSTIFLFLYAAIVYVASGNKRRILTVERAWHSSQQP